MKDITLVFPHQLFERHPAIKKGRRIVLVEDSLFFGDGRSPVNFHKKKLVLHRASMKAYAERLRARGHDVRYVDYDRSKTCTAIVRGLIEEGYEEFHVADVCDRVLSRRLSRALRAGGAVMREYETPMLLTPRPWLVDFLSGQKRYRMGSFYVAQRKRMRILTRDGRPAGGKWSFDEENRRRLPEDITVPLPPKTRSTAAVREAASYVSRRFPRHYGGTEDFRFPTTHSQARSRLKSFLESRLPRFGAYEDAISSRHAVLFHSVLSPALNIGLITPSQVIDATLAHAEKVKVPLNSLEGFVRQIIGWREFIYGMYLAEGASMRRGNFWRHHRPIPESFYRAETGVDPVDLVIGRVLENAYCHHIERLMVLGNFMLLCGIGPDGVYRWFMELFIDAYDWVMVPNVYGMSQFADGGLFATKPYLSGSNYIRRMSDFPPGPWCGVWDSLFWDFIRRNREFFERQPRLSLMAGQLKRMGSARLREHRVVARRFIANLFGGESA